MQTDRQRDRTDWTTDWKQKKHCNWQ